MKAKLFLILPALFLGGWATAQDHTPFVPPNDNPPYQPPPVTPKPHVSDVPQPGQPLIQNNQALKHDVKVELLARDFLQLHDSGKVPELSRSLCFVRERIHQDQQDIVISQFFDYTKDPNTVWMAEVFDSTGNLKRRLLLNYDADATKALRTKDAKYSNTQVFTWFEHVIKEGQVTEIDAYLQIFALPDYQKFRSAMFIILANPPKPIYSAPVDATPPH
jgi:hypothetical protein